MKKIFIAIGVIICAVEAYVAGAFNIHLIIGWIISLLLLAVVYIMNTQYLVEVRIDTKERTVRFIRQNGREIQKNLDSIIRYELLMYDKVRLYCKDTSTVFVTPDKKLKIYYDGEKVESLKPEYFSKAIFENNRHKRK